MFEPDGAAITSRLLNGSLHVRSNEPHGTEVHIYLPVVTRNTESAPVVWSYFTTASCPRISPAGNCCVWMLT